ncbi:aminopeptidase N [Phaeobacter gallaeciensis]|uniref:Aminopeptidase N n=1 Tax=Phaeobacter gallaeciensis TaxID=60890 RepID=A0A1B0ZW99_9RHOB|nr:MULTISPECIES: aminopeptidase N [Phaeobacter]MDF1770643.1 aminopeptidase N [Pseudophaeobacter sp. bin_em_oilr2.035]ANP38418.1 aminopeptidase N [Phaeobacter gallaeciensis]MDE4060244.1 aminopeptidase N [Phaeobacter gallaeciensis]MDE4123263.1 aminopeptidase N [Phaeobacter gallaeciensis]MDE4127620.1 aminopeptidase N [Phaeobacter gallaeciensis]
MKDAAPETAPETFYLKDYTPFGFEVQSVELTFRLAPGATRVQSRIHFAPKPGAANPEFFLHGEQLSLISAAVDGAPVTPTLTEGGLTCNVPDQPFVWEAEVEIDPQGNTALEGLYMSNGMYCTQCEAEGFRKITYYPDRPDVMSTFKVRIEGDEPVKLSNGNPTASGAGWAEWHDPWPKPAYLFALVAGDLVNHPDSFTTMSGKEVELNIWVRPGDEGKCAFGMEALKKSMKWDEDAYGREYDLDIFNIVAVDDFNMGAMENKGLNIFNSSCVLASPETSTDANFERIEAIIAHEYFHNWTGNRITCRDWFQLCLKEGLTVFRDAQFTADMRSAPVKRISDVIDLRARQFPEDGGPLAHPVRPEQFQEINNFYTATIYEKGAEVIGMLKRLVGDEDYAKAVTLYFDRHDGQACTIEDWLKVFEDATGRDLSQFKRWYSQAGTPHLKVSEDYADGTYTLTFEQSTPPTPGQPDKDPRVIPIAVGLLGPNGDEVCATRVLEMTEAKQSFTFDGLAAKPVPSILREFSAPVILERETSNAERAFLLAHDTDPFNRWEAGNALAREARVAMVLEGAAPDADYLDALQKLLRDDSQDPAFRALVLSPPSQSDIAQTLFERGHVPDPQKIFDAAETFAQTLAQQLADSLPRLYADTTVSGAYSPDAISSGKRDLNGRILSLLTRLDGGQQAARQYEDADNMTQQYAALTCLLKAEKGDAQSQAFFEQWKGDRLVMDKWFALQIASAAPETAASVARDLTQHELFTLKNPNRFRAVMGALAGHHAGFHHASGAGYRLLAENLIALDKLNPQTTARMCAAFQTWKRYDADRQALIRTELERIAGTEGLSRDTTEMVTRILDA